LTSKILCDCWLRFSHVKLPHFTLFSNTFIHWRIQYFENSCLLERNSHNKCFGKNFYSRHITLETVARNVCNSFTSEITKSLPMLEFRHSHLLILGAPFCKNLQSRVLPLPLYTHAHYFTPLYTCKMYLWKFSL
jgi:hypothetical protein